MAREQFADTDFRMGLNKDMPDIVKSEMELSEAVNVEIMNRGGVRKRFGVEAINTDSYNAEVHQIIEWPRDDGNIHLLALIGNELCEIGQDGVPTVVQVVNADRIPYFFLLDKLYFIDPGTEYYVYDGSLSEPVDPNPDESNNLNPIKNCELAHYHSESNRVFFAKNPNNITALYYSEFNQPDFVKGTSVLHPTRAEGAIRGMSVLMDAIIVGYCYGAWIWRGVDPEVDAIWEKLPTSHGPVNEDAFALTRSSLSMVSQESIFALLPSIIGVSMENEAGDDYMVNITKDRVSSLIKNCTNKSGIRTIYHARTGRFLMAYSDQESGVNNKILNFDFDSKGFGLYEGLQVNDFCQLSTGELYAATDNYILKFTEDSVEDITADGVAAIIPFKLKTAKYNFDNPFERKKISKIFLIYKNFGPDIELTVKLFVDDEQQEEYQITGDDSGTEIVTKRIKTYYSGNYFQLEIENNQYSEVEIYGLGFYYEFSDTGGSKADG